MEEYSGPKIRECLTLNPADSEIQWVGFMPLKDAEVETETELEGILIDDPQMIEEGFRILKSQRRTTPYSKRLDLLGVDAKGTLTVVELKVKEDDGQLPQAMEYFDWLLERGLSFFRDYFSEQNIESKTPRLLLIAPKFSERTIKLSKYISEDIEVSLMRYLCFEIDGKKEIKLVPESVPPRKEIEQPPPKIEDHINYITDEDVREVFAKTIDLIKELDPNKIKVTLLPYRINFIHKSTGLKFAELYSRRSYFLVEWKEADDWGEAKVETLEEVSKILDEDLKKAIELVKKK